MRPLCILLSLCIPLSWLYEHSYVTTYQGYHRRPRFIYFALMTVLVCFGGFRGQYNDTWTYRDAYVYIAKPFPEAWNTISWDLGENPAFQIVMSFLKTYDVEVHLFLFFFFFWTTLFFMMFIRRYHTDFTLTIYFFITMGSFTFNMAAMKQVMATGICLAAIPLAMEKKWLKYYVLIVGVSALFHPYSLMYLIVPFMTFQPWSKWGYVMLTGIIVGGFLFRPLVGTVIDITTAIGENYTTEMLSGEGISILRLLAFWIPVVLSFIYRKVLFCGSTKEENLFVNLMIVYAGIMFMGLFGTALYFGRLSNYFSMMPVIALPWMLRKIREYNPKDGLFISACAVVAFFMFFYFSNTLETVFSTSYAAVTPGQFLKYFFDWIGSRLWAN